jgi:DNA-binding LacI/PurR family transcriptional regulator
LHFFGNELAKYQVILDTLERRIKNGDYRVRQFPSFSDLADELHANHRTISKALTQLIDRGALVRLPTGRVAFRPSPTKKILHLAMLAPAYPSPVMAAWHRAFERLATERGWQFKLIGYEHWRDPTIFDAIRGFDGIAFMPLGDDLPQDVLMQFKASGRPIVVLEHDVSADGLPCLRFVTPAAIHQLLAAIDRSVFKQVCCLNTQPMNAVIQDRIAHWQLWNQAHGTGAALINEPVEVFDSAIDQAYAVLTRHLRKTDWKGSALFCTTGASAIGAMRALIDAGLQPGVDVALCAADDDAGRARYLSPSLTSLRNPDWDPYLQVCLDWFGRGGRDWMGPLLVQPAEVEIFIGESTGRKRGVRPGHGRARTGDVRVAIKAARKRKA